MATGTTTQNQTNGNGNNMNLAQAEADAAKVTANVPTAPAALQPRVAHTILVSSIMQAAGSFKAAIDLEVAVCLTVFAQYRNSSLPAKKELYAVYREAGYKCEVGGEGEDYKTVNRRVNYAASFFDSLPEGTVDTIMGEETRDAAALMNVVSHLASKYSFRSMNDVLTAAGIVPPSRQVAAKKALERDQEEGKEPGGGTPTPAPRPGPSQPPSPPEPHEDTREPTATDAKVIEAAKKRFEKGEGPTERQAAVLAKYNLSVEADSDDKAVVKALEQAGASREADQANWHKLMYEGATLWLPVNMKPDVLGEMAIKLMTASHQMKGKTIDIKVLDEAFAMEAAH